VHASKFFLSLKDFESAFIFSLLSTVVDFYKVCDFLRIKICKTYPRSVLPPGGLKWQLVYPNFRSNVLVLFGRSQNNIFYFEYFIRYFHFLSTFQRQPQCFHIQISLPWVLCYKSVKIISVLS